MRFDPLNFYAYEMEQQKRNQQRNQQLLHKQLFDRAFQRHLIENQHGNIVVLDHVGAVNHFNHHPDLFQTIPFNAAYLTSNKKALERTLTQAWQYVNSPTRITDIPHF